MWTVALLSTVPLLLRPDRESSINFLFSLISGHFLRLLAETKNYDRFNSLRFYSCLSCRSLLLLLLLIFNLITSIVHFLFDLMNFCWVRCWPFCVERARSTSLKCVWFVKNTRNMYIYLKVVAILSGPFRSSASFFLAH